MGNSARNGGRIYAGNSNVSLNGTFIRNYAIDGGGIFAWSHSNVNINGDTTFIGNLANVQGGGVYTESNSNMTINGNTTFCLFVFFVLFCL